MRECRGRCEEYEYKVLMLCRHHLEFSMSHPAKSLQPPSSVLTGAGTAIGASTPLPCSLQPCPAGSPRPKSWLCSEEAWAQARREVEERRRKVEEAELEMAEAARKQLERNTSQAVREARTKLLDKVREDGQYNLGNYSY